MSVLVKIGSEQQAVNRITGTIAALVKESVWEELLKGKSVGVLEPDPERYSLFIGHQHAETIKAKSFNEAVKKAQMKRPILRRYEWGIVTDLKFGEMAMANPESGMVAYILSGYPDRLRLPIDRITEYQRRGLDAEKCAAKTRDMVRDVLAKQHSYAGAMAFMDEIDRGMQRLGRD